MASSGNDGTKIEPSERRPIPYRRWSGKPFPVLAHRPSTSGPHGLTAERAISPRKICVFAYESSKSANVLLRERHRRIGANGSHSSRRRVRQPRNTTSIGPLPLRNIRM